MAERVYIIVGPTAAGKTEIALLVAEKLDAWIISADSRQVYLGMDIGTAKPGEKERGKIRHFCIDLIEPDKIFSAADFLDLARDIISRAIRNEKKVLIVGGTGLYVKALVEGFNLANTPRIESIHNELIKRLEERGIDDLVNELRDLDSNACESIDIHNPHRVIRALEIVKATGKKLNEARGKTESDEYEFKVVGLSRNREYLRERIRTRTYSMLHQGWLDEVREIMKKNYPENSPAMTGIGYRELRQFLNGEITKEYAIEKIITRTNQYAKRQMTWFAAQDYVQWLDIESDDDPIILFDKIMDIFNE